MTDFTAPMFSDEDAARAHLEEIRWANGIYCPHCGNTEQASIRKLEGKSTRPGLYQCNACREHFTVTVGSAGASAFGAGLGSSLPQPTTPAASIAANKIL